MDKSIEDFYKKDHLYKMSRKEIYKGFEAGPIRPPSESGSLMLRVTRNCPWNKCRFCMLYKGEKFAIRPVEHIKEDIDRVRYFVDLLAEQSELSGSMLSAMRFIDGDLGKSDRMALFMAHNWLSGGGESAFLQDANTLLMKPVELAEVISYLREKFPGIRRITSYGRSHTISAMKQTDIEMLNTAGLTRVHVGVESGSDRVLTMIKKGVTKAEQVDACNKVKQAGIELSVYYMPGLGGAELLQENALESADGFSMTNPDYIRIRTLAVLDGSPLARMVEEGELKPASDRQTAEEILLFLQNLRGINSYVKSDHILNLFQEVEGALPDRADEMMAPVGRFLSMSSAEQLLYIVGRRALVLKSLSDLNQPQLRLEAEKLVKSHNVTPETLDMFVKGMLSRFI